MTLRHSPEPWRLEKAPGHGVEDANGNSVSCVSDDPDYEALDRANAERYVACVNAMADLDPRPLKSLLGTLEEFLAARRTLPADSVYLEHLLVRLSILLGVMTAPRRRGLFIAAGIRVRPRALRAPPPAATSGEGKVQ